MTATKNYFLVNQNLGQHESFRQLLDYANSEIRLDGVHSPLYSFQD